jgi:hypothetical protein
MKSYDTTTGALQDLKSNGYTAAIGVKPTNPRKINYDNYRINFF